ncbi:hypothetical protein D3C75_1172690 [compost metagenome]
MAKPIPSVACTISGARAFGRICRYRMTEFFTPMALLASTYSFSRSETVWPNISRANSGMPTMPTAIIALVRPAPMEAAIAMDSTSDGKESRTSIRRMIIVPVRPP